jgi:hypothetical protein
MGWDGTENMIPVGQLWDRFAGTDFKSTPQICSRITRFRDIDNWTPDKIATPNSVPFVIFYLKKKYSSKNWPATQDFAGRCGTAFCLWDVWDGMGQDRTSVGWDGTTKIPSHGNPATYTVYKYNTGQKLTKRDKPRNWTRVRCPSSTRRSP